jgi:protein O-mannosyl-transferase
MKKNLDAAAPSSAATLGGSQMATPRAKAVLGLLVVLITLITFSGVKDGGFTNWDDPVYVFFNKDVTTQNYGGCLTTPVTNSYNPLQQAIFAWEWGMAADEPALMEKAVGFHILSWLLHVLTTLLVYLLLQRLGLQPIWAALAALLWGIHPLRVESVAWVSELKDVLYALFFVATLLAYLQFVKTQKRGWWALALLCFLLALMSKVQAATLPVALLAIDWYQGRKVNGRNLLAKAPFFIGSLAFGIVGLVLVLGETSGIPTAGPTLNLLERGLVAVSVFGTYLCKQFIPYAHSPAYPMPTTVGLGIYLKVLATLAAVAGVWVLRKRFRAAWFAFIFFGSNVVIMLVNGDVSHSFMADRFTYVASIGVFFALLLGVQEVATRGNALAWAGGGLMGGYALLCMGLTASYVPAWQTSLTLWEYTIRHYPRQIPLAYLNRADYYGSLSQFELAQNDFDLVVTQWPDDVMGYLLRGRNQLSLGRYAGVVDDETHVINAYAPTDQRLQGPNVLFQALLYRSVALLSQNRVAEAISDATAALVMRPEDSEAMKQRGDAYVQAADFKAAIGDYTRAIGQLSIDGDLYNRRGFCYMNLKEFKSALADFDQAIALSPQVGQIYNNRAFVQLILGNRAASLQDARKAKELGFPVEPELLPEQAGQE